MRQLEIIDTFGDKPRCLSSGKENRKPEGLKNGGFVALSINTEYTPDKFKKQTPMLPIRVYECVDLGLIDFRRAWYFQREVIKGVKAGIIPSTLVFCQHNPVITLGSQGKREHIKTGLAELELRGIEIYEIERGGGVTYHGPGQIVVYPIFNLCHLKKDVHWFIRKLEDTLVDFLADFGIKGARKFGLTGVWVDDHKIASIGVAIKGWITFHGISINVKKSVLNNFKLIKPCGLEVEVTSLENVLGKVISINHAKKTLLEQFRRNFLPGSSVVCNEKFEFCMGGKDD